MLLRLMAVCFCLAALCGVQATQAADAPPVPAPSAAIMLISPKPYQVFQRESRLRGEILVSGRAPSPADAVQVRISGTSLTGALTAKWLTIPINALTHLFNANVPAPAGGWYAVQVQSLQGKRLIGQAAVAKVGVGEVFIIAGQSNSTNYGETCTTEASGMISSFSGTDWRLADDPQPGTHDNSPGGSPWPAFGDALYARYRVPIAIASTGYGGTSVNQWQPGNSMGLFEFTETRIREFGYRGFRAVLWHQGEADPTLPAADYAKLLANVIDTSHAQAGWAFPWFVAQVSYHNPGDMSSPNPRAGQKQLWENGIALPGPDTDTLTGDNRAQGGQDTHFSLKGLHAHGLLWAQKVSAYLDTIFAQENKK